MDVDAEAPTWELDSLCPGGPDGPAFDERRHAAAARISALDRATDGLGPLSEAADAWAGAVLAYEQIDGDLTELGSFATCAASVDSGSGAARAAEAHTDDLRRHLREVRCRLDAAIDAASDAAFDGWVSRDDLAPARPWVERVRSGRRLRLAPALQALKVSLDREAVTGWGRLYDQLAGDLVGELRGEQKGVAELAALRATPDPELRRDAFRAGTAAWSSIGTVCAHALTHLTGARQQHHDRLGVDELAETLFDNRLARSSLDAMWAAADAARPALVRYLGRKAELLGKDALDWWDLDAPVGGASVALPFDGAVERIAHAFDGMYPELGQFAREVATARWVDARAGAGRRGGGFCTSFPRSRQSRIFMTYTGTLDNATTLAHELGHAWHNRVLEREPVLRTDLTSALAETASTFGEAVFRDRQLSLASDPSFRQFMLDQQLQAAVAFLMDIPHRFRFERRLYELRRQGLLEPDQLSAEVVAIQRASYGGALASWNPTFWCSKLHFYIPEFGFYNWPYTFGYLFSGLVHARAKAEGPASIGWVKELLLRTGWQDTDALASEVLGLDLSDPATWVEAVRPIEALVDAFVDGSA
ncbi:MAG: M3 family metallopeptidase [Myxococcota bacterium]